MADSIVPPDSPCKHSWLGPINCGIGVTLGSTGRTTYSLLAAIAFSLGLFGIQVALFLLLRTHLSRIYRPRSFLVPKRQRVAAPPRGLIGWLSPLFNTPNEEYVQKCGLDAYFFLRFLRTLLKFFIPIALIVMPILIPINRFSGNVQDDGTRRLKGLDRLSISNVSSRHTGSRLWAHLILAVCIVVWFLYLVFVEMLEYIRIRQAYLTSPQHRIRASATTVLVTAIPRARLSLEDLHRLYDVFPGGVKNIWVNRNFDKLSQKIRTRQKVVEQLEAAETKLIAKCVAKATKAANLQEMRLLGRTLTREELRHRQKQDDIAIEEIARNTSPSADDQSLSFSFQQRLHAESLKLSAAKPFPDHLAGHTRVSGGILARGLGAFISEIDHIGKRLSHEVKGKVALVGHKLHHFSEVANAGKGFVDDDTLYSDLPPRATTTDSIQNSPRLRDTDPTSPIRSDHSISDVLSSPSKNIENARDGQNNISGAVTTTVQMTRGDRPPGHIAKEYGSRHRLKMIGEHRSRSWFSWRIERHTIESPRSPKSPNRDGKAYPSAHNENYDQTRDQDAAWRRYIQPRDRETILLPRFSIPILGPLPFLGQRMDRIYWLRFEIARLNLEIETDQQDTAAFSRMNSAFIQFNHQAAAHMACQSVNHHIPYYMKPRMIEISPDEIIWDNMSIHWWERYVRNAGVFLVSCGLVVIFAIPITFTSLLSKVDTLVEFYPWLRGIKALPGWLIAVIQGALPPILLLVILLVVPLLFGILTEVRGVPTRTAQECGVQVWYFAFLFFQVFFVVTLTGGLAQFFSALATNPSDVLNTLASTLPLAANYFFSYLVVQALSNSAGALLQVVSLMDWFIYSTIFDSTPRSKWKRQTTLSSIEWGSFFPTFTNFAVIGIIYSAIAPLILLFMLFIFSLFWIVYRYNVLYVYQSQHDTGGLLYPTALNQLFTGIYFLELCLTGFFIISTDDEGNKSCIVQAAIMGTMLFATLVYHWQLNRLFGPLLKYLPVTFEHDAAVREQGFARALENRSGNKDATSVYHETRSQAGSSTTHTSATQLDTTCNDQCPDKSRVSVQSAGPEDIHPQTDRPKETTKSCQPTMTSMGLSGNTLSARQRSDEVLDQSQSSWNGQDLEAQRTIGDALFGGFACDLEDLSHDERDMLVRQAFRHSALRARRPVIWIPRDRFGVSDDEIRITRQMSTIETEGDMGERTLKTNISISNEGTAVDSKGRVVFRRSPPDFGDMVKF